MRLPINLIILADFFGGLWVLGSPLSDHFDEAKHQHLNRNQEFLVFVIPFKDDPNKHHPVVQHSKHLLLQIVVV